MTNQAAAPRPFTGWHMFAILAAFFGVVFVVNFYMARQAARTFGGEVVENSYVASQNFNRWLDEAAREKALGWTVDAGRTADGKVELTLAGASFAGATVVADARHPLGVFPDTMLHFTPAGNGRFVSKEGLQTGRWRLRIDVTTNGTRMRTEEDLR